MGRKQGSLRIRASSHICRMDKMKQNQEEVVGKDAYEFWEREDQDTLLPKSEAGGRNLELGSTCCKNTKSGDLMMHLHQ